MLSKKKLQLTQQIMNQSIRIETISENTENVNSNDKINVDEIIEFASDDNAMIIHKQQKQSHRLNQQQKLHQQAIYQQQCMQSSRNRHLKLRSR